MTRDGADFIVWPENALPLLLNANPGRDQALRTIATELGAPLLAGGSRSAADSSGKTRVFNSAFWFAPGGGAPQASDKLRLMPYTETRPHWATWLSGSPWQGAYAAGDTPRLFELGNERIGSLLCFEAADPRLARRLAARGASVLVNLSNDSWFDAGAGPEQKFESSRLRAVETRRPLIRVATTGISAVVDASGDIMNELPARVSATAIVEGVAPAHLVTLYVQWGDWMIWASMLAGGAASVRSWLAAAPGG